MSVLKDNLVEQIEAVEAPLKERWHRLQAAYRFWNLATHHLLGFTVKLALLLYFGFTILFLALRWVVLPNIDHYKSDIESLASRAVGNPVVIDRVYASWKGLRPQLILGDVVMRDARGQQALHLPSVSATLSWWSVPAGGLRFESLEFHRPEVDVRREADGKLYAAGIYIDLEKKGDGKSADWLLSQRELVVRDGRITWTDLQRGSPPLQLDNVTALMLNKWRRHQFAFKATPPATMAAPLDVRADFSHQPFSRISDVKLWKGELYAELRRADLAGWKPYLPGKLEVQSASGGVRAWLSIDSARPAAITADVALDNVVATLGKDLPQLDVAALRGRVTAGEERAATLVATAGTPAAITRTLELKDVTLRTRDGVELAPTTASARHVTAANQPSWTEVKAAALDLKILSELATRLPLPQAQRDLLAEAAPRGRVRNLVAGWRGPLSAPREYKLTADLDALGMEALAARPAVSRSAKALPMPALPNIPGFEKLSGHVEAGEQGGSVALDAPGFTLAMPAWFDDEPMAFEQFKLNASWSLADARQLAVKLDGLDLVQDGMKLKLAGSHTLPRGPGAKGPGVSDFSGSIDDFTINRIGRYLPKQTPEHTRHWLVGALEDGMLRETSLRLRGDLSYFPFKDGSPDKAKGEFRVAGRIADGRLNYEPGYFAKDGKTPVWPLAEKIRGSIVFDRARMEIKAETARTLGVALSNVKAVIPDLSSHDSMLDIDGSAAGPMQDFLKYVTASPVLEWIGHFTDETTASGNARLALNLHLPLSHIIDAKVLGALQLQGNDVMLWHDMPSVAGTTGKIEFDEKGVNLNNLAGTLLGGPLSVTGGSQKDGSIQVRLAGTATVDGLRRQYPTAAVQRLANHLGGGTKFNGLITAKDHKYEVAIDSSMQGASLDFPAPLKKAALDSMPLHFQLNGGSANEQGVARDDIRVTLGNAYAARYHRMRVNKGPWKLVNGGIGVNLPAPEPDSGMMINASLKSLNVDDWIDLASEIAGNDSKAAAPGASEGADISQYVVPETMAARAAELIVGERKLDNVVAGVTHSKGVWQASIDSQQAAGYVTWNESPTGKGVGKVTARLSSLIIPESQAAAVKDLLESSTNAPTIPALDIEVQRLEWFNRPLGQLELHAYNALITSAREWRISKLSLVNADGELNGTGRWQSKDGQHNTALNFNMDIHDAGKLLERFGFKDTLRNGKGKLSGDIAWKGLPYHMDLPSLSGTLALNVEKGQFLKQDPGAAKLLGVLSLQALPRLLKLDFNDVFSEGLQFDGITANATINHGIVKTENLKMHGVQATVLMDGTADIANESTNLRVVVIPQVNLGTAPLVYALAVNPVIGLGSYLAQLFLSAPVMKALTYQMQVTGPWKAPVITKIENPKEATP
ncbi:YhdP family protein [Duganella sp. Root1480D1]|uniref:YhdP family protein n=1 Tax=Duganella sp. Root1480D1 TaxID=1736471 RepID=UPI000B02725E|nr:YhdP family protein [Duganella sp. Root1480D1]